MAGQEPETQEAPLPLAQLSVEARELLGALLDTHKPLPTRSGRARDWRGLAAFADIPCTRYDSIAASGTPTAKVLELWTSKDKMATVGHLQECLQNIDRYDVYDDTKPLFERGAELYEKQLRKPVSCIEYTPDNRITYDDVLLHPKVQKYHAFVLYAAEDFTFAGELMQRLKNDGFKVCSGNDLLIGFATKQEPLTRLISERCQYIIVIYSPEFLTSRENNFYMNFAQAIGIETGLRKIIPCMYRECALPFNYKYYHTIYYSPERTNIYDFWEKLTQSVQLNLELPRGPVTVATAPAVPAVVAVPAVAAPSVAAPPKTVDETVNKWPTLLQPAENFPLTARSGIKPKSLFKKVFHIKSKKSKSKAVLEAIVL